MMIKRRVILSQEKPENTKVNEFYGFYALFLSYFFFFLSLSLFTSEENASWREREIERKKEREKVEKSFYFFI